MKTKNRKMTLTSAIIILIMGSIGTGIFFKNTEISIMTWDSLLLIIMSWLFSSIGIFLLAFSLSRLIKNSKISDLGLLDWVQSTNINTITKSIKGFILLYYLPLIRFGVIFYVVMAFQNAIGWSNANWWEIFMVVFAIITVTQFMGGTWLLATKWTNRIFVVTQAIPILFVVIYGIYSLSVNGLTDNHLLPNDVPDYNLAISRPLLSYSPYIGFFSSIPSIYFVYDGFYKVASMQSDMKEPHKIKYVILFGMIALVLLNILMSFFLITSFGGSLTNQTNSTILKVANWMIIGSALGNLNLNAMMGSRMYEIEFFNKNHSNKIQKIFNKKNSTISNPYNGSILSYLVTIFYFVPSCILGSFLFFNSSSYSYTGYLTANLYSFIDILINWSSVFIFCILLIPIVANLKKSTTKDKIFDIFTIIFILIPLAFIVFETFYNLLYMIVNDYWYIHIKKEAMISVISKVILLIINFSFILIPMTAYKIKDVKHKNKLVVKENKYHRI